MLRTTFLFRNQELGGGRSSGRGPFTEKGRDGLGGLRKKMAGMRGKTVEWAFGRDE